MRLLQTVDTQSGVQTTITQAGIQVSLLRPVNSQATLIDQVRFRTLADLTYIKSPKATQCHLSSTPV